MATRASIQTGTVAAPRAGAETPGAGFYIRQIVRYVLMAIVTLLLLGPFILAFFGSFKTTAEVLAWPPTLLPTQIRLQNYDDVWNVLKDPNGNSYLPRWLFNSAFLSATVVLTQLFFCSLAAYAFARLRFPGREAILAAALATLMVPGMVILIPKYQILNAMHLLNNYGGIILPGLVGASGIFLLTQFFRSIPRDLEEAAYIDGAGIFTTYWRIVLPLARPALATLAVLNFQGVWNDFLTPLVVMNTADMYPLTVGLSFLKGQFGVFYNLVLAGSMFNTIPMLVLFTIFSRFYVQGSTYSGVKG